MERLKCEIFGLLTGVWKSGCLFLILWSCTFGHSAKCQDTARHQDNIMNDKAREFSNWGSQPKIIPALLPAFFEKGETIGSPYLSSNWMRGVLDLSDHRRIPRLNEYLYFNYDKVNTRLILINRENRIWSYPVDSISGFVLADSDKIYSFEKIPAIGKKFLLELILKSERGYSLYKRLITRLIKANYESLGYTSNGKKYDEYVDDYEYYLIYPDKKTFKKFYLEEKKIRKLFKDISVQPADFFNHIKNRITEQDLVSFIETINISIANKRK
jgi:hypothetical protein